MVVYCPTIRQNTCLLIFEKTGVYPCYHFTSFTFHKVNLIKYLNTTYHTIRIHIVCIATCIAITGDSCCSLATKNPYGSVHHSEAIFQIIFYLPSQLMGFSVISFDLYSLHHCVLLII